MASLFSPKMKPQPVTRMPDPEDKDSLEARRRRMQTEAATRGRESTNLSGGYSNSVLGK